MYYIFLFDTGCRFNVPFYVAGVSRVLLQGEAFQCTTAFYRICASASALSSILQCLFLLAAVVLSAMVGFHTHFIFAHHGKSIVAFRSTNEQTMWYPTYFVEVFALLFSGLIWGNFFVCVFQPSRDLCKLYTAPSDFNLQHSEYLCVMCGSWSNTVRCFCKYYYISLGVSKSRVDAIPRVASGGIICFIFF